MNYDPGMLIVLLGSHVVCDIPLQGDKLSGMKRPECYRDYGPHAYLVGLLYHALVHAAAVRVLTGSTPLAWFQLWSHFLIDWLRVRNLISCKHDQLLHLLVMFLTWIAL